MVESQIGPLPWACYLAVVVELECLNDPKSYAG